MKDKAEEGAAAVRASGLVKHFGDIRAVDGVDFEVPAGVSFGFLGPNGAGKTTLMRMICCLAVPTGGTLRVLGMDPLREQKKIKADIGIVPQLSSLDEDLTVIENLVVYSRYHAIPPAEARRRSEELLDFVSLSDRPKARVPELSGGMQRRLLIARALINRPKILVLDEPTTGLDPQVRHHIWQRMRTLKKQGITLLITTHYMDEAEHLCDEIVIMDDGKIIERGSPADLVQRHIGRFTVEADADRGGAGRLVEENFGGDHCRVERFGDRFYINADDSAALTASIEAISELNPTLRPSTLEDVFLKLTGRELSRGA